VTSQLEQAVKNLRENAQIISDLRRQTKRAEGQADKMERALNRAQNELLQRDREIAELRLQISHGSLESPESQGERDEREEASQRMLKVAQETIQQLKVLHYMHLCRYLVAMETASDIACNVAHG